MKRFSIILSFFTMLAGLVFTSSARATLIDRGNGLIYDDDLNITWMQYVNTAVDTEYCNTSPSACTSSGGLMNKTQAQEFVDWFNNFYHPPWPSGVSNWRLPVAFTAPDPNCSQSNNTGYNCTQSELGHLFYLELGNHPGEGGLINSGPFRDIEIDRNYWTDWDSVSPGAPAESITFNFRIGFQIRSENTESHYVWLVHDGDIAPTTECNDGIDNDGDGRIDYADPGCENPGDNDESNIAPFPYRYRKFEVIPKKVLGELWLGGWIPAHPKPCILPICPDPIPISAHSDQKNVPIYIHLLGEAIWRIVEADTDIRSVAIALSKFQEVIEKIPIGTHFNGELKKQFIDSLKMEDPQRKKTGAGDLLSSTYIVRSLNAIELDWRLPELKKQHVRTGKYVDIDLNGMVWVGFSGVEKSGEITLGIISKYEAFPEEEKFTPSWPFFSYVIGFNGKLEQKGFLNLTFYVKQLLFKAKVSSLRVLQLDKRGLIDITTGMNLSRGIVMARTDHPGTFIIVGKN